MARAHSTWIVTAAFTCCVAAFPMSAEAQQGSQGSMVTGKSVPAGNVSNIFHYDPPTNAEMWDPCDAARRQNYVAEANPPPYGKGGTSGDTANEQNKPKEQSKPPIDCQ